MDITTLSSVHSYTKNLKLQTQWDLKRKSGDLTSHKKSLDEWLSASTAAPEEQDEQTKNRLRDIQQKIFLGKKLTEEERQYLKAKDPQSYAKLESNEQEQRAYERELKRCKTKEEVQRLKMTYINASLVTVKAVEHNPEISKNKKLEIIMQEKQRCSLLEKSTQDFVRRGDYERLPSEAEEARAEQAKAERENTGTTDAGAARKDAAPGENAERPAETPERPDAEAEHPVRAEQKTVETEEERKVRRAKARAAYTPVESGGTEPPSTLNLRA